MLILKKYDLAKEIAEKYGRNYRNYKIVKGNNHFYVVDSNGDWGLGIGDWGLGIGDWAQSPIPNPQSPYPKIILNPIENMYFNLDIIINII